jgi:uncharacterized protein (TIGR02996 family)
LKGNADESRPPPPAAPRPEVLAFLRDSKAHPDDDTPRLVLADWLEERGDPRGEFVRTQCLGARLPEDDPRCPALLARQRELLNAHRETWLRPLPGSHHLAEFHRGLVRLVLHPDEILGVASPHFAETEEYAWVEGLRAYDVGQQAIDRYLAGPAPEGILALHLAAGGERVADRAFVALARSPHLCPLTALRLTRFYFGAAAKALATSPHLAALAELDLQANRVEAAGARALAASPHLTGLRSLDLGSNDLQDQGARALIAATRLERLTDLGLGSNRLGPKGVAALVAWPLLANLTALRLDGNSVGGDGTRLLAGSPAVRRLARLDLRGNRLSGKSVHALAASPNLTSLTRLDLTYNVAGDRGAAALAAPDGLPRLTYLSLRNNGIGDKGTGALAASPWVARLRTLDLAYNPVGPARARALAESPYLDGLWLLDLTGPMNIGPAARRALQKRFGPRVRLPRPARRT